MVVAKWGQGSWRRSGGGHCGREMEEQKRMHLVTEWVSLEQKVLQSAKRAVPLAQTIITVHQISTILTGTIKLTIHHIGDLKNMDYCGTLWQKLKLAMKIQRTQLQTTKRELIYLKL